MNTGKQHYIMEREVLKVVCPVCKALPGVGCRTTANRNIPLAIMMDTCKLAFHEERVEVAEELTVLGKITAGMPEDLKTIICVYAFVMMADSVAVKSKKVLGKQFSTEEVQAHFVKCAIDELRKEGILDDGTPSDTRRIIQ